MIFLIEYDRHEGHLVSLREFKDSEKRSAQGARLRLELSLKKKSLDREVVLLEAADRDALRATHRRYFEFRLTLDEFVKKSAEILHAFEHATRLRHQEDPETFPLERDEDDWWNEVAAYLAYPDVEELLLQLRQNNLPEDRSRR
jgi:hypothetical protein